MLVHSKANIEFSNKTNVVVEQSKLGIQSRNKNIILSLKVNEELSGADKNPVGTIAYNNMTLKIQSPDNLLTPENSSSPYFGLMNSTAIITLEITDINGSVNLGTYYVDRWYSNISSDEQKSITIEASGYMKTISKMLMPSMQIRKNQSVKEYILEIVEKQNQNLTDRYKIQTDSNLYFGDYGVMEFSDIDDSNIGQALETISKCTVTNIFIDRDNKLKTDYCFDDVSTGKEYKLGDCINIKQIKVGDGGLSDYSGVEVEYSNYIVNNVSSITELNNQKLQSGITEFNGINTNGKLFKLVSVKVDSDAEQYIQVDSITYDKNKLSVKIENTSTKEVNANIKFMGQTLNENKLTIEKYIQSNKGNCLQITNNIIGRNKVDSFADKLLKLVGLKNTVIQALGWIDCRVKLGDIVYLDAEKTVNTKGYYKVIKLEWNIESSIQCNIKLVKLIK